VRTSSQCELQDCMQVVPEHMTSQHMSPTLKVWQAWPGRHSFFCDGRVMVGPDFNVTIFAMLLTTGATVTFWIFVCMEFPVWVFVVDLTLWIMTMGFMIATATTDPGIIPSNRGMEQAEVEGCANAQRFMNVNGVSIQLKWCRTCHIFRPPRASHCSECNVCVERFDHHCPWMGTCIGRRNYRYFLGFVNSCCLLCLYTACLSGVFLYHKAAATAGSRVAGDFLSRMLVHAPAALGLVAFCGLILLCVGPLGCYHCSLVCENKTTAEELKQTHGAANPFDAGICHNCNESCCVPRGEPRIQFRALVSEPERLEDTCGLIANDAADGQYDAGTQEGLASGDFGDSTYGTGGLKRLPTADLDACASPQASSPMRGCMRVAPSDTPGRRTHDGAPDPAAIVAA